MEIRTAILAAAQQIEDDPRHFRFMATGKPHPCETAGCALGWIGYFANLPSDPGFVKRSAEFIGIDDPMTFYAQMDEFGSREWEGTAPVCASYLRQYADKYHAATAA